MRGQSRKRQNKKRKGLPNWLVQAIGTILIDLIGELLKMLISKWFEI